MRIAVMGTGRVGLVTAVSFASCGRSVIGFDTHAELVESLRQGRAPFFEPGLDEQLRVELASGRLAFTASAAEALVEAEAVFVCVGRPLTSRGDRSSTAVELAAIEIARHAPDDVTVIVKSTSPPGTCERVGSTIRVAHPGLSFAIVSSPEFLREGYAMRDTLRPERIVVGADDPAAFDRVRELFEPMLRSGAILIETDPTSAELSKLAANSFLSTKISFANALAGLCEVIDADVRDVTRILGSDPRIGKEFLEPGLGYGGYCLPKDIATLEGVATSAGCSFDLLSAVRRVNDDALARTLRKIEDGVWNVEGKRIALLGLAFKAGTDDVRASPAIALARSLLEEGAEVVGSDPMACGTAKEQLPELRTMSDPYETAVGAQCLVVGTAWREYADLDPRRLRQDMAQALVIDAVNVLPAERWRREGFIHIPTGRRPERLAAVERPVSPGG